MVAAHEVTRNMMNDDAARVEAVELEMAPYDADDGNRGGLSDTSEDEGTDRSSAASTGSDPQHGTRHGPRPPRPPGRGRGGRRSPARRP